MKAKPNVNVIGIALNLSISLGTTNSLSILGLLFHKYGISLCLYRFLSQKFYNFYCTSTIHPCNIEKYSVVLNAVKIQILNIVFQLLFCI